MLVYLVVTNDGRPVMVVKTEEQAREIAASFSAEAWVMPMGVRDGNSCGYPGCSYCDPAVEGCDE